MPKREDILQIFGFAGIHRELDDEKMAKGQLRECRGFSLDRTGVLKKQKGWTRYNATSLGAGPILGLHRHLFGTTPQLLVVHDSTLYLGDDGTGTLTSKLTGLGAGNRAYFDMWKDFSYLVNGVATPKKWDGATATNVGGAAVGARFVTEYADRLFMVVGNDELRYSELLDPETWINPDTLTTNLVDVDTGTEYAITGLIGTQTHLKVFQSRGVFYLRGYDPAEWVLDEVSSDLGCIAPRSILDFDGRAFWLSERGVFVDDGSSFDPISAPVQEILDQCTRAQLATAVGMRAGPWLYRLALPDHPSGARWLDYDVRLREWTERTTSRGFATTAAFAVEGDNGKLAAGDAAEGTVYYLEDGGAETAPNGTTTGITAALKTKRFGIEEPSIVKELRQAAVHATLAAGDSGTLRWYFDGSGAAAGSRTLANGRTYVSVPVGAALHRDVAFEIEITGTGIGSEVLGLEAEIRPRRERWAA